MDYLEIGKIYNEDSRTGIARIRSSSVGLLVTEPPYPTNFQQLSLSTLGHPRVQPNRYGLIPEENYQDFTVKWLHEVWRAMNPSGSGFIFCHWRNLRFLLNAVNITGFRLVNHIIWRHPSSNPEKRTKKRLVPIHFHILYITKLPLKEDKNRIFHRIPEYSSSKGKLYFEDVWNHSSLSMKHEINHSAFHSVMEKCIRIASNEKDLVLDPFLTSHSLLISCLRYKRAFIGFAISERDYETIQQQIARGIPDSSADKG